MATIHLTIMQWVEVKKKVWDEGKEVLTRHSFAVIIYKDGAMVIQDGDGEFISIIS
jgi:hypothetical protein